MSQEPRVYRRREGQILIVIGIWGVGMAMALWAGWPDRNMLALAIVGPMGPILYLFGPCVSVAVTPYEVIVNNTSHRWRIARSLLALPGHGAVDVAAMQTAIERRTIREARLWFRTAMAEVGALPDDGKRRLRVHWTNVLILAVALAGWALSENYIP